MRKSIDYSTVQKIKDLIKQGISYRNIAKDLNVSVSSVMKYSQEQPKLETYELILKELQAIKDMLSTDKPAPVKDKKITCIEPIQHKSQHKQQGFITLKEIKQLFHYIDGGSISADVIQKAWNKYDQGKTTKPSGLYPLEQLKEAFKLHNQGKRSKKIKIVLD